MTPEEKAAKREAVIEGMVAKGYTRERAEEVIGLITKPLFGPGGRFSDAPTPPGGTVLDPFLGSGTTMQAAWWKETDDE